DNQSWQLGYFHECMSGFEYEVASHMIAEGMTDEGLVLVRSIHDRYHAAKRNPYNEIECSDHYARAMASYGAFITACGFEYHGPKGFLRFAPKWNAENFKAPFTAAEGWGSYTQTLSGNTMTCVLEPKYGQVQLSAFSVDAPKGKRVKSANVSLDGQTVSAKREQKGAAVSLSLPNRIVVKAGERLVLEFKL
ncbi:MAG: glycoside hydrolase family 116 protein, partial [Prevotellaceae bacterium]|nr:glycoside hydrolase family 116 protein [Prevotellaceae bacterium]